MTDTDERHRPGRVSRLIGGAVQWLAVGVFTLHDGILVGRGPLWGLYRRLYLFGDRMIHGEGR